MQRQHSLTRYVQIDKYIFDQSRPLGSVVTTMELIGGMWHRVLGILREGHGRREYVCGDQGDPGARQHGCDGFVVAGDQRTTQTEAQEHRDVHRGQEER